jgi:hypothetical protein
VVRYLVLAAIVAGLNCSTNSWAADNRSGDSGLSKPEGGAKRGDDATAPESARASGLQSLAIPPMTDSVSKEGRLIQADFQKMLKDCDDGDYSKAEADLNQLIIDRQRYYAKMRGSTDGSPAEVAPAAVPQTKLGKQ